MSGLREYRIPAPGDQTITVQLSDEDAKRYGDKAVEVKASTVKSTKARTPANKAADVETKAADADGSGE